MNNKSIFYKKILEKKDIIFQDNLVTAFNDINPLAPVHILIVTNKIIPTINHIEKKDRILIGHCFFIASKISKNNNLCKDGYRLISNCGKNGGQEIFHFHIHLVGGKFLGNILC